MPDADRPLPSLLQRRFGLSRVSRWALGIALILLAGLIGVWSQRRPIASGFIDRALADRRVAAKYRIADLGFDGQRLTDVVIGDPAHPDLVADWVEVKTQLGLSGATVTGLRAGEVRVRGRLTDGRVSFGTLDRLLPSSGTQPFALPAIDLEIADGRLRLETSMGLIGLKIAGRGRANNGFAGRVAAVSTRLDAAGCAAEGVAAALAIRIIDGQPSLRGPVRAGTLICGATRASGAVADIDTMLGQRLDRWRGRATLALASLRTPSAGIEQIGGDIDFDGSARRTTGNLDLLSGGFRTEVAAGDTARLKGQYRVGGGEVSLDATASMARVALAPAWRNWLAGFETTAIGTPVAPLAQAMSRAAVSAARAFSIDSAVRFQSTPGGYRLAMAQTDVSARSGAHVTLNGGDGIEVDSARGSRINGLLAVTGGGLPEAAVRLSQSGAGGAITGSAIIRPYAAAGARLALSEVNFTATSAGSTRLSTRVTLSGPIGAGSASRIDGATLPIEAEWDGYRRLTVNSGCALISFDRLAYASLVLGKSKLGLCPVGPALLRIDGARVSGGAQIAAPRLAGRLGSAPITIAATNARYSIADGGLSARDLAVRLGHEDRVTRLDLAMIEGTLRAGAIGGHFAGGAGQIARVPLLMSAASGDWRLKNGRLAIDGALAIADADADPRFNRLAARNVALTLANNAIAATATLADPDKGVKVTDVTIAHDLSSGRGHADLALPGIAFNEDFQPDRLTRFTYGVIADVKGRVSGEGHIRWTPDGVTSDGVFRTTGTDLAAAFGPVTGLSGEIRFTDLLALESAPGQVATVAEINPGVPVTSGVVHYQTLADQRIAIEGARWPFAGGELTLDPALLDLTQGGERRLTFKVAGVNAAEFLQQFDFKNLDATGTFDGALPMIFDQQGGRIENGRLSVREAGGGTLAYVGEISQKDVGFWGNLAFQALKSLRYRNLDIVMNGPLAGEMITEVRFAGVSQGQGAKSNFLVRRLQRLPFVFNVRIQAPFRQLIDSAQSFYDPRRLIERNLPALIKAQDDALKAKDARPPATPPSVQPPESEKLP